MTGLTLQLLGPFVASYDGQPLSHFRTRAVQALFIYLANQPEAHRRESLMALLWPDVTQESAQNSLRQALYHLRQAIPEVNARHGDLPVTFVVADRQMVQVNPEAAIDLDVAAFEGGLRGPEAGWPDAVALYRGDFLCDFYLPDSAPFEEWVLSRRADLRRQAMEALDTLVVQAMGQKAYEAAEELARRQLAIDNLHERGHRRLMEILVRLGQRSQALAQYETCRRLLAEELGVEPSPKTEALYEQIRTAELGTAVKAVDRVRGYDLKEALGAGAFGVVYRAVQPAVGREVAVKVINPQHANRPDFIRRFEAEARIVARLEHPHIVPLYDYWREPDGAYLVMRYLRGGNLHDLLRKGQCDLATAVRIMDQVTAALEVAHRREVVHRDIKPANILLDEEGNAYLTDFGIAKELTRDAALTQEGQLVGSPAYLAPEQVLGQAVSPQSDIYSLGVVLYELLTGEHPFRETPVSDLGYKHAHEPLPSTRDKNPELPAAVDAIIQRATAKTQSGRYPDARALALALHEAAHGTTSPVFIEVGELVNPYKGLRPFEEADAADFFGRQALVEQLQTRMTESDGATRFLAVVGPSGSGKSSVVKAGLLPALRQGALPSSEQWFVVQMTPGERPLDELEIGLLRVATRPQAGLNEQLRRDAHGLVRVARLVLPDDETSLLLVVDQFEELFAAGGDPAEREHFLQLLATAAAEANSPVRVLITLRADFYDRPLLHPSFGRLVKERTEVVLPLTTAELAEAITAPATRAGAELEEGLAAAIVADVADEAGALPMFQYALTELFARRDGRLLTREVYEDIGGVSGALARRAEEVYSELDGVTQEEARQLFLRLVTLGEGVEDTRRRVRRSELEAIEMGDDREGAAVATVLDTFGRARLLTFDRDPDTREPTVEVAHEALLREWPRLREWLDESRDDVRLQRLLAGGAAEWLAAGQDSGLLLRGTRLDQFGAWKDEASLTLTGEEREFLDASLAARQARRAEEETRRQRELQTARQLTETEKARAEEQSQAAANLRRRALYLAAVLVVAVVFAIAAGIFGQQSRQNANAAATSEAGAIHSAELAAQAADAEATAAAEAHAQRAVAEAESVRADEQRDAALAAQATAQSEGRRADDARLAAQEQAQLSFARELAAAAIANLEVDPERSALLALHSLDVTHTLEAEEALHAAVPRLRTLRVLAGHEGNIIDAAYSPDGSLLVTACYDGKARVWDTETGEELLIFSGHGSSVGSVVFSPDGAFVVTGSWDGTAKMWDPRTGEELFTLTGHQGNPNLMSSDFPNIVEALAISPDGKTLATGAFDRTIILWDTATGEEVRTFTFPERGAYIRRLKYTTDGQRLITTAFENAGNWDEDQLIVFDVATGAEVLTLEAVTDFDLSSDGTMLLTGHIDNTALGVGLWNMQTGTEMAHFYPGGWMALTFSPDGSRFATGTADGATHLWETATGRLILTLRGHQRVVNLARFSPDGSGLATVSNDGTARLWDIRPSHETLTLRPFATNDVAAEGVKSIAFSPNGAMLAAGSLSGQLSLWDAGSGERLRQLAGHDSIVNGLAFSPDGSQLSSCGPDGALKVWKTSSGELLLQLEAPLCEFLAYSPDGATISTVSSQEDGQAIVWDAATGDIIHRLPQGGASITLSISPDGRFLATATIGFWAPTLLRIWDLTTGELATTIEIADGATNDIAFSFDGSRIFSARGEGTVRSWDTQTGELVWQIRAHLGAATAVRPNPNGRVIATTSADNSVRLWDPQTGELLLTLHGHTDWPTEAAFSPDGMRLATAGRDGTVRFWVVPVDELAELARGRLTRELTDEECQTFLHMEACP